MFTGIIQEIGIVEKVISTSGGYIFSIKASKSAPKLKIGKSISINGVCHTVIKKSKLTFSVETVEETLKKTSLGQLNRGNYVNLELPLQLSDRFDGHIVLGHVDCTGLVHKIVERRSSKFYTIEIPKQFTKYIIERGSISIDGVSLTIAESERNYIDVSIIPHTLHNTIFQYYAIGSKVNIEFDILGKYIEHIVKKSR